MMEANCKEDVAGDNRKRPREETYETLAPKMKRLQEKLAEGPMVRRRFSKKFWSTFRLALGGAVAQWRCKGVALLTVDDLNNLYDFDIMCNG